LREASSKSGPLKGIDLKLLYPTIILVAIGLVMVTSASQIIGYERFRSAFFFMQQHAIRIALGCCMLMLFMKIDFKRFQRLAPWLLVASFVLLVALFVWGIRVRGANRWLRIYNFNMQPVELAKLTLVIFLSAKIADPKYRVREFRRGFLPLLAVCVAMAAVVALQPNFSNAFFIMILSFTVFFIGGCRLHHIALSGLGLSFVVMPFLLRVPHIWKRVSTVLGRGGEMADAKWHVEQSLIALGSGFITGRGPGAGYQKYYFLPDAHTDFIFSIIGEELGLIGTLLVLSLFVFIMIRAARTAYRAPTDFGYVLSIGLGLSIFMSAMINIAMTLGIIPVAGLPLPFVSFGGTSLITSLATVGILLNISSQGRDHPRRGVRIEKKRRTRGAYAVRARYAGGRS
jgi:cell division protein FtsW